MEFKHYLKHELSYIKKLATKYSSQNLALHDFLEELTNNSEIELLFENFAYIMAKMHNHIDDTFPEIAQNLLLRIYPTKLCPIPSTTILQFYPKTSDNYYIKKKSKVTTKSINNHIINYQTVREIAVIPLKVININLINGTNTCDIYLKLKFNGRVNEEGLLLEEILPITFFLSPCQQIASLLKLWFEQYLTELKIITADGEFNLTNKVLENHAPNSQNLALPLEVTQFWRLLLMQQYLLLPHIDNFITINIMDELKQLKLNKDNTFVLLFRFNTPLITNKPIDKNNSFFTNCVSAINLNQDTISVFNFIDGQSTYSLKADNNDNIFQINKIYSPLEPKKNNYSDQIEYLPITKFTANNSNQDNKIYYQVMRKYDVTNQIQNVITFIDKNGNKVTKFKQEKYICDLTTTSGNKIKSLEIGDICVPTLNIPNNLSFYNITKPTIEIPPVINTRKLWLVISHLSLSPIFLRDIKIIKQLLAELNYNACIINAPFKQLFDKKLQSIIDIDFKLIDWFLDGFMQRGIHLTIHLDNNHFQDEGDMYSFSKMLAHTLPFCIANNNFLITKIVINKSNKNWIFGPIKGSFKLF